MRIDLSHVVVQNEVSSRDAIVGDSSKTSLIGDVIEAPEDELFLSQSGVAKAFLDKAFDPLKSGFGNLNVLESEEEVQLDKLIMLKERGGHAAGIGNRETAQDLYSRQSNNIEQFVHMQLPVQLDEDGKVADLYVFKRKGSKAADSEDVNILLVIDLEFMGRWEALLKITDQDVSVHMEVLGDTEKEQFDLNLALLQDLLFDVGFNLVGATVRVSKGEGLSLVGALGIDKRLGGNRGGVDFVV